MTTISCGFWIIARQKIPMKNASSWGLYKAGVRAYNAAPFPKGLGGNRGLSGGEPARRGSLHGQFTTEDPVWAFRRLATTVLDELSDLSHALRGLTLFGWQEC